jgi:hypothetical protein
MKNLQGKKVRSTWGIVGSVPPLFFKFFTGTNLMKGTKHYENDKEGIRRGMET